MKKLFFLLLMTAVLFCPLWAQETEGGGGTQGVILETAMSGNCMDNCTVTPDTVSVYDADLMTNITYSVTSEAEIITNTLYPVTFEAEIITNSPCSVTFEADYIAIVNLFNTGGLSLRGT